MDGGIGSELQAMGYPPAESQTPAELHLGLDGALRDPEIVKAMHRRYVDAGADILLTNTFLFHRCVRLEQDGDLDVPPGTWRRRRGSPCDWRARRRRRADDPIPRSSSA